MGVELVSAHVLVGRKILRVTPFGFLFDGGAVLFTVPALLVGTVEPGATVDGVHGQQDAVVIFGTDGGDIYVQAWEGIGEGWLDGQHVAFTEPGLYGE